MSEPKSLEHMDPDRNDHEKLTYEGAKELPPFVIGRGHMTWNETGTWRYMKPRYRDLVSPCVVGCPNGQDVEAWIRLIAEKKYDEAMAKNMEESPLPGVCGRACFHPCERRCNRAEYDEAVSINQLERFLSDKGARKAPKVAPDSGKKIAVVGSGPAGLAAAYHLRRMGHQVTVYDALPEPGGVLRYGIPDYRLPRDLLAAELAVLESMGIEFKCNVRVGSDLPWDSEELQSADKVFVATGVHRSRPLGIEGEDAQGVSSGLKMLETVAKGDDPKLGDRVLVIGGGNTAVDAARTAIRLGAKVTIIYRRSRDEMPAHSEEVEAAEAEGVVFQMLASPVKVLVEGGKVKALECIKMELGEPDASGRRRPVPVDGSNFTVPCDNVITAVGEQADTSFLPETVSVGDGVIVVDGSLKTADGRFYAGGDVVDQPHTIVDALAAGKRAAIAMDCDFRGVDFADVLPQVQWAGGPALSMRRYLLLRAGKEQDRAVPMVNEEAAFETLNMDYFHEAPRADHRALSLSERLQPGKGPNRFREVELGLTEEQAQRDAERCFHCGRCIQCDNCYIFCPDVSVLKKKDGYDIDDYHCKGCGVCVHECPRNAMEMVRE